SVIYYLNTVLKRHASSPFLLFFFFHPPTTTEIYTLSLHDALPISYASVARYLPERSGAREAKVREVCDDLQLRRDAHVRAEVPEQESGVDEVCAVIEFVPEVWEQAELVLQSPYPAADHGLLLRPELEGAAREVR